MRLLPFPEYEHDPPGPKWEPVIYDGSFPQLAEPGDIYINRYRDPPLYYLFNRKGNCELVSREEIKAWVTGGLMKVPPSVQPRTKSTSQPSQNVSPLIFGQ